MLPRSVGNSSVNVFLKSLLCPLDSVNKELGTSDSSVTCNVRSFNSSVQSGNSKVTR